MKTQQFMIGQIPAVLYGEHAEQLWLFLHGQMGHKEEAEAFAKIVCPKGAQVLGIDLPGHGARQGRDEALNPWTVVPELLAVMDWARVRWNSISLRANSIGAYFAMLALDAPDKVLLVSPILDMERLILDMMGWANVTERELSEKGEIVTSFGQTLSWAYLCYVREHPNDDIYRRTANCFCKDGIEFGYAVLKNTSPHNYALFMAARDLCDKTEAVTMADLAEPEVIDPEALRLIVNATLIARYGLAAFQIRARGAEYER